MRASSPSEVPHFAYLHNGTLCFDIQKQTLRIPFSFSPIFSAFPLKAWCCELPWAPWFPGGQCGCLLEPLLLKAPRLPVTEKQQRLRPGGLGLEPKNLAGRPERWSPAGAERNRGSSLVFQANFLNPGNPGGGLFKPTS